MTESFCCIEDGGVICDDGAGDLDTDSDAQQMQAVGGSASLSLQQRPVRKRFTG